MPAPTYSLPVSGSAPNQLTSKNAHDAEVNRVIGQLWSDMTDADRSAPLHLTGEAGTANAIVANIPAAAGYTDLAVGQSVIFTAFANNTGPATITIGGQPYELRPVDGSAAAFTADSLIAGRRYPFIYTGLDGDVRVMRPIATSISSVNRLSDVLSDLDLRLDQAVVMEEALPGKETTDIVPLIVSESDDVLAAVDTDGLPVIPMLNTLFRGGETSETFTGIDRAGRRLFGFDEHGNPAWLQQAALHYGGEDWDTAFLDDFGRPILRWLNGVLLAGTDFSLLPKTEKDAVSGDLGWNDHGAIRRVPAIYRDDPFYNQTNPPFSGWDAAQVYALYDGLMADFPSYITRSSLGQDQDGVHIYQYVFSAPPLAAVDGWASDDQFPTIAMVSGIHGNERQAVGRVWLFARNLCRYWRDLPGYSRLRFGARLVVVPVACPYGFANEQRLNKSGVDVNRNFPANWTGTVEDYPPGPSAGSELETLALMQLRTLHPGLIAVFDHHNGYMPSYFWFVADKRSDFEMLKGKVVPPLSDYMRGSVRPDLDPQEPLIRMMQSRNGSFPLWFHHHGVSAITLEQPNGGGAPHPQTDGPTHRSGYRAAEIAMLGTITELLDRDIQRNSIDED